MLAQAGAERLRVVLADDTPEIRSLLRRSFELDPGVEVVAEAADGAEAVEAVVRTEADVVLLDLAMPVMDGLQAIPTIRRRSPDTRIVVLSGFDAAKMAQRAIDLGASAYVSKGAQPGQILSVLREVTGHRPPVATGPVVPIEAAYRRRRDLIPLLTHEISNQLTVIHGFALMLHHGLGELPEETALQFTEAILRNSNQMRRLLDAVSDLRQLDEGQLQLDLGPVDLVTLVQETLDDLQGQLAERNVFTILPSSVEVDADAVHIRQTLTNLVGNAAKFTPPGANVAVELSLLEDAVELSVTDDGPGIPPGREGELFQKFSRLGSQLTGTGIGLYLSRAIARAHGGDLYHVPQPDGCRFTLRLPRTAASPGVDADGGRRRAGAGPAPAPATT